MKSVRKSPEERSIEERNFLQAACYSALGSRRAAGRNLSSVGQREKSKGNEETAKIVKIYCRNVQQHLEKICDTMLDLLEGNLICTPSAAETKVFYQDMILAYYSYIDEFSEGDKTSKAAESARQAYEDANKVAEKDLPVTWSLVLSKSDRWDCTWSLLLSKSDGWGCKWSLSHIKGDNWECTGSLLLSNIDTWDCKWSLLPCKSVSSDCSMVTFTTQK